MYRTRGGKIIKLARETFLTNENKKFKKVYRKLFDVHTVEEKIPSGVYPVDFHDVSPIIEAQLHENGVTSKNYKQKGEEEDVLSDVCSIVLSDVTPIDDPQVTFFSNGVNSKNYKQNEKGEDMLTDVCTIVLSDVTPIEDPQLTFIPDDVNSKNYKQNAKESQNYFQIAGEVSSETFKENSFDSSISSSTYSQQNLCSSSSPISRKRRPMKNSLRKICLQSGKAHTNSKGNFVEAKKFKLVYCNCRLKCMTKLSLKEREDIFKSFWDMCNWQSQSMFIVNSIKLFNIKRRTTAIQSKRNSHREFYFNNKRICKKAFLSTLGISDCRLEYALKRKCKGGLISPDRRGGIPYNKTPESTIMIINDFLNKFPKFKSHYSHSQKTYFHPDLTIRKLYDLLMDEIKDLNSKELKVSHAVFARCFRSYNVAIYLPKKDTCQFCDRQKIQIEAAKSHHHKTEEIKKHEIHLHKANYAREYLAKMTFEAKKDSSILCFSFDMEKTQPIPYMNTSVIFYKRQLWLLNLGINTRHNNQGYMCLWNESEGKRGGNEVCSCLFEFLQTQNLHSLKKIVTFSDGCCGQNRNKTVISFVMFACSYFGFETWEHTYLESGHSFLPNDTDFAQIEKRKKRMQNIYTEGEWIELIKKCNSKNPFKVINMKKKFLNFKDLQKYFTFRSQDIYGDTFSWHQLKWFQVSHNNRTVQFKTSLDPETPQKAINFATRKETVFTNLLPETCPRVEITYEKYADLVSILHYIPPVHHEFFKQLPHRNKQGKKELEIYPAGFQDDDEEIEE